MFAFCIKNDSEFQVRIRVTEEEKYPGQPNVDINSFTYAANVSVFKINYSYPPSNVVFTSVSSPCLSSFGGNYIPNFGLLVTDRVFF